MSSVWRRREALWTAAFWFLSPFTLYLSLRGMESAVSTLLLVLLAWALMRVAQSVDRATPRAAASAGLLLGLAGLGRTDNLLTAGAAGVVALTLPLLRERRYARALSRSGVFAAAAAIVVLPWFLWNLHTFGELVQVSALVKLHSREIYGGFITDWHSARGVLETRCLPPARADRLPGPLCQRRRALSADALIRDHGRDSGSGRIAAADRASPAFL